MMKKLLLIISLGMLILASDTFAQEAKFKATFTLNFIRYIGWPEDATKGDFVIGVLRNKEIADHMREQSAGKKFGFQDVVIKEFKNVEEISKCQVIYVSSMVNISKNAATIIQKAGGKNVLLITETEGAASHGAAINFVIRDEKLKFELSKSNASKYGLQLSSKLESMASAINL
jgi:hypothetical protein